MKRETNPYKGVKYNKLSDADDSDDESDQTQTNNRFELKNRQNGSQRRQEPAVEYINYEVKADESLRTIALRYGCSVSTIKRLNHLMSDHEFYGLRVIKLPVKKFGILSDVLVHQINSQSQPEHTLIDEPLPRRDSTPANGSLTVNIGISQHLGQTSRDNAFKFLSHMDEDLQKIRESTKTVIESSNIDNLDNLGGPPIVRQCDIQFATEFVPQKTRSAFHCDQSDYGISWFNLLLGAFVLLLLLPIVYVVYISEHHSHHNSTHNSSTFQH